MDGENKCKHEKYKKTSQIYGAILTVIFCLSLYIRVALPYDSVFSGTFVRFGGNDPWYNMLFDYLLAVIIG